MRAGTPSPTVAQSPTVKALPRGWDARAWDRFVANTHGGNVSAALAAAPAAQKVVGTASTVKRGGSLREAQLSFRWKDLPNGSTIPAGAKIRSDLEGRIQARKRCPKLDYSKILDGSKYSSRGEVSDRTHTPNKSG